MTDRNQRPGLSPPLPLSASCMLSSCEVGIRDGIRDGTVDSRKGAEGASAGAEGSRPGPGISCVCNARTPNLRAFIRNNFEIVRKFLPITQIAK